jgi:Uma2 family endonuclease
MCARTLDSAACFAVAPSVRNQRVLRDSEADGRIRLGVSVVASRIFPRVAIVVSPQTEVAVLDVGWPGYEALLEDTRESASSRMAYDGEVLEITAPTPRHEVYNRLIELLVREAAREWKIDLVGFGSTTFRAKPRGAEPDSSFYVGQRAELMRNCDAVELGRDPAPDLVIEIDMSRSRIEKKTIYAAFGVPEFWRYDGERLRAFDLTSPDFPEIGSSIGILGLPIADVRLTRRYDSY